MKGLNFGNSVINSVLEGRKTVTRRPKGLHFLNDRPDEWVQATPCDVDGTWIFWGPLRVTEDFANTAYPNGGGVVPPYRPGEIVFVKEEWQHVIRGMKPTKGCAVLYKAEDAKGVIDSGWYPSKDMPEWAARILLEILSVRPERIRDCDNPHDEVLKEGWPFAGIDTGKPYTDFAALWQKLYPGSWENNEWVWRVEFRVLGLR